MTKKASNQHLSKANKAKKDEFYTQLTYIERELGEYKEYFKWKVVFCNCDDPEESNFWKYFAMNFEYLGLKKLISTHYESEKPSYKLEIVKDINNDWKINQLDTIKTPLKQNWDFRSPECIAILEESDIVVTNPPFSLFRDYVAQLIEYKKKFVIIGNQNAVTYKEIFPLLKSNKMWLWHSLDGRNIWFRVPNEYEKYHKIEDWDKYAFVASTVWFTNLDHKKRQEKLILYQKYKGNEEEYPDYENYNIIEVGRTKNIPIDYDWVMWVPITFMHKYNPNQFEIIWLACGNTRASAPQDILDKLKYLKHKEDRWWCPIVDGKRKYARILIRNKSFK